MKLRHNPSWCLRDVSPSYHTQRTRILSALGLRDADSDAGVEPHQLILCERLIQSIGVRVCMAEREWNHVVVLSTNGIVITWGRRWHVTRRMGSSFNDINIPTRVPQSEFAGMRVVQVSVGATHTLALSELGTVFICGCQHLGLESYAARRAAQCAFHRIYDAAFIEILSIMVAAGNDASTVLRADGSVFSWGVDGRGQLGLNDSENKVLPTQLARFGNAKVVFVAMNEHTVAIQQDGTLWVWGSGRYGQLGLGDRNKKLVHTLHPTSYKILMASCGAKHTVVATEEGYALSCGSDYAVRACLTLERVTGVSDVAVVFAVSDSRPLSHAITRDGSLYAWRGNIDVPIQLSFVDDDTRMGLCGFSLPRPLVLALAMATHSRLGGNELCLLSLLPKELVRRCVDAGVVRVAPYMAGFEGVSRLIGNGMTRRSSNLYMCV